MSTAATPTDPVPSGSPAEQDYRASMHEVRSNLDVRRLMLVIINVLVPALVLSMLDCLTGTDYPESIAWLPRYIIPIVGLVLAIAGTLVTGISARCHFGLVVNGSKMGCVLQGRSKQKSLNWLGVTTNFVALIALSAGAGLGLFLVSLEQFVLAAILAPVFFFCLLLVLLINHVRANRLVSQLQDEWPQGDVSLSLQEEHTRLSLEATTSDISVIVTMAVALFAGTFGGMAKMGAIVEGLPLLPSAETIRTWGVATLAAYTLVSLLLSGRMVVRLRIALAEHSQTLAHLRHEPDDPYRFSLRERTFLLFLLLQILSATSGLILAWSLYGMSAGLIVAGVVIGLSVAWYTLQLRLAGRRA